MIRTKNTKLKNPSAILCSDFHLRETTPLCRTDDFQTAQWNKLDYISQLQIKYHCPVIHAGDLFDHWKPSPWLLSMAMIHLPDNFMTIYGQHDLPQHSLDLIDKCGVNTLQTAKKLEVLNTCHWGQTPSEYGSLLFPIDVNTSIGKLNEICTVLVWHVMTWTGALPWPGCTSSPAEDLLVKYPQFNLILTGDNHKTFTAEVDGRLLVNPGSLTRQDADQEQHRPCVFLWYAQSNSIECVFLPAKPGVVSREHIEHKKEHDERISAFVERLDKRQLRGFDFKSNLQQFMINNQIRESVKDLVWRAIDNE